MLLVTAVGAAEGARPAAAALACAGSDPDRAALLIDIGARPPRPTLLASPAARTLEGRLAAHLPRARVAARGQVCHLASAGDGEGFEAAAAAATVARGALVIVHAPSALVQPLLETSLGLRLSGALLRAEVREERSLLALVYADLSERGIAVSVLKRRLPWVAERRALFGTLAPGSPGGLPGRTCDRLFAAEVSTGISVLTAASRAGSDSDSAIRAAIRPREGR